MGCVASSGLPEPAPVLESHVAGGGGGFREGRTSQAVGADGSLRSKEEKGSDGVDATPLESAVSGDEKDATEARECGRETVEDAKGAEVVEEGYTEIFLDADGDGVEEMAEVVLEDEKSEGYAEIVLEDEQSQEDEDGYADIVLDETTLQDLESNCKLQEGALEEEPASADAKAKVYRKGHGHKARVVAINVKGWNQFVRETAAKLQCEGDSKDSTELPLPAEVDLQDWNSEFQRIYGQVAHTPHDLRNRAQNMHTLVDSFVTCARQVATVIVKETVSGVPLEQRRVLPKDIGGQAGGEKFVWGKILFKFATNWQNIYPNEASAQTAAANEVRAMNVVVATGLVQLRTTLTALFRLQGYVVYATAVAPLDKSTLVYGSVDAARTIRDSSPAMRALIHQFAVRYNLARHAMFDRRKTKFRLEVGVDVEGHRGRDGRYYLLDTARVFPCVPPRPGKGMDYLYRLFRPEFLTLHCHGTPLSSDAFSGFSLRDPKRRKHERAARASFQVLMKTAIPSLAETLQTKLPNELTSPQMADCFHRHGVNLRYLSAVREAVPLESEALRDLLLLEMVARAFKTVLRTELRVHAQQLSAPTIACVLLLALLEKEGDSELSDALWDVRLPAGLQFAFDFFTTALLKSLRKRMDGKALERVMAVCGIVSSAQGVDGCAPSAVELRPKVKRVMVPEFPPLVQVEKQLQEELQMREEALRHTHPSLAGIFVRFLDLYRLWSDENPEGSLKKGKAIVKRLLSLKAAHPKVENVFHMCARFLDSFGLYECALGLFTRELEERRERHGECDRKVGATLSCVATVHKAMGSLDKALTCLRQSLDIVQKTLGEAHPNVARVYVNLGSVYELQEKHQEALQCHEQALEVFTTALGAEHPDTGSAMAGVGNVLLLMGKQPEALEKFEAALVVLQASLGPEHPEVGSVLQNIGNVKLNLRLYPQALEAYERTLAIKTKALGAEHPDVGAVLQNMAFVFQEQGNHVKALECCEKALVIRKHVLGSEHVEVAHTLTTLGSIFQKMEEFTLALQHTEQALAVYKKTVGMEHPSTAKALRNLGIVHRLTSKPESALQFFHEELAILKTTVGEEHPEVAATLMNIGTVYSDQGKNAEALDCFQRSLAVQKATLGEEHLDVALNYNMIGVVYEKMGEHEKAMQAWGRCVEIMVKVLGGTQHVEIARALHSFGVSCQEALNYQQALKFYQQAFGVEQSLSPPDHVALFKTLRSMGLVFSSTGNFAQALPILQQAHAVSLKAFDPAHIMVGMSAHDVASVQNTLGQRKEALQGFQQAVHIFEGCGAPSLGLALQNLGVVHQQMGNLPKALHVYERALAVQRKTLGEQHVDVAETLENLGTVLQQMGKLDDSLRCFDEVLSIRSLHLGALNAALKPTVSCLAALHTQLGHPEEMVKCCERMVAIVKETSGPQHVEVGMLLLQLATLQKQLGNGQQALLFVDEALSVLRQSVGETHPFTQQALQLHTSWASE